MQPKILIIEDEEILGEILQKKLTLLGYETELATDGAEGMEKIRSFKPELILLDIVLPNLSGYEILEKMKEENLLAASKVIVISNSGQPVEIDRVLELGAIDYLVKADFSPEEVVDKVTKALPLENITASASLAGKKILVVEDDIFLRNLIVKKMEKEGCAISLAYDGDEALKLATDTRYDLVLLDLVMPNTNGIDTLKELKKNPNYAAIPVIIFSNLSQDADIDAAKKAGAADFIIKSNFTLTEVIQKIKQVLGKP
ncbi:MAG: hypothetical protein A3E38_00275 [Candidatus Moranbacteria bacterium RIFCSPHIGHO2_12_FULL_54_9]|nr:MAG: hypothetical protein A2878_02150 [Candidatus Moranbacteria bacterium RIFCSPHIGHO2_01_FULL_54_31]OGI25972.1 MAG: hypothetical protein A3E38_00275 [Candidatus Moranbacteria bacterium RIFCSPHIGHO2_12_FULL_54_9]